jgi:hypothetical protein
MAIVVVAAAALVSNSNLVSSVCSRANLPLSRSGARTRGGNFHTNGKEKTTQKTRHSSIATAGKAEEMHSTYF